MLLSEMQKIIHENAVAHGFWEEEDIKGKLLLCHEEISEAAHELRDGNKADVVYIKDGKPEGFPIELADCLIRILDICEHYDIDAYTAILLKHEYNKTRPYKHGKQF